MLAENVAVAMIEVFRRAVEHLRRNILHCVDHLARGLDGRVTAHEHKLRSDGIPVVGVVLRIRTADHFYHLDRDVKLLRRDLGDGGQSALTVVNRADHDLDVTVAGHLHDDR